MLSPKLSVQCPPCITNVTLATGKQNSDKLEFLLNFTLPVFLPLLICSNQTHLAWMEAMIKKSSLKFLFPSIHSSSVDSHCDAAFVPFDSFKTYQVLYFIAFLPHPLAPPISPNTHPVLLHAHVSALLSASACQRDFAYVHLFSGLWKAVITHSSTTVPLPYTLSGTTPLGRLLTWLPRTAPAFYFELGLTRRWKAKAASLARSGLIYCLLWTGRRIRHQDYGSIQPSWAKMQGDKL